MTRGKTTTQTFRFDTGTYEGLLDEAAKQKISMNSLVSHALHDYVKYGRHANRVGVLRVGPGVWVTILNELSEESVRKVGAELGKSHPRHMLSVLGLPFNEENAGMLLEEIHVRWTHWVDQCVIQKGATWSVNLTHNLRRKWSLFLSEYVMALFETLGFRKIGPVQVEEFFTNLRFQTPPPQRPESFLHGCKLL